MTCALQLYEDVLADGAHAIYAGAGPRMVYVVSGRVALANIELEADSGTFSRGHAIVHAGAGGATCWRYELADTAAAQLPADGAASTLKLAAELTTAAPGNGEQWLMRLDSVAFPPGGCALLHTHQGPGIRCLIDGSIRIDTDGHSQGFEPGGAWFEAGPEPVFAAADAERPSRFIRAMILPGRLQGQSSIRYVRDEDRDAPKSQSYRVYAEQML